MSKTEGLTGKRAGFLASIAIAGTSSVIAVNFTHPIEVWKTRKQVGNFDFKKLIAEEGFTGFYKGIQAGYLREISYTSLKLGLYAPIRNMMGVSDHTPFYLKFLAGSMSGSIGSVFGNPFDVMKTIMMSDPESRVTVRSIVKQMMADQGLKGFFRGVQANIMRACVLNGTKMACYDQIKGYVVKYTGWKRKDLKVQFLSSICAGFCMTLTNNRTGACGGGGMLRDDRSLQKHITRSLNICNFLSLDNNDNASFGYPASFFINQQKLRFFSLCIRTRANPKIYREGISS